MEKQKTFELAQELPSNQLLTGSGGDEVGLVYMGIKPILYSISKKPKLKPYFFNFLCKYLLIASFLEYASISIP